METIDLQVSQKKQDWIRDCPEALQFGADQAGPGHRAFGSWGWIPVAKSHQRSLGLGVSSCKACPIALAGWPKLSWEKSASFDLESLHQ